MTECIFGKEIRTECLVRLELEKSTKQATDLTKIIKSPIEAGPLGTAFDTLIPKLGAIINPNINTLVNYCKLCPWIRLYDGYGRR